MVSQAHYYVWDEALSKYIWYKQMISYNQIVRQSENSAISLGMTRRFNNTRPILLIFNMKNAHVNLLFLSLYFSQISTSLYTINPISLDYNYYKSQNDIFVPLYWF